MRIPIRFMIVAMTGWLCIAGCHMTQTEWERFWTQGREKSQQPEAEPQLVSDSAALRDAIAPLVTIQGMRLNRVRGFGLVVDLVDTGGRDGPEVVKNYIIKEIRRTQEVGGPDLPPTDILNSRDTTMVQLTGDIPAGAREGDRFDILVEAIGGETKSLVGGRLVLGDLKIYAETPSGVLGGKTLATAEGAVFVSPFNRRGKPSDKINLRRGVVLGGGIVTESRKLRLVLNDPSPSRAKQIERQLNGRYSRDDPIALVESSSVVALKFPPGYYRRKHYFLEHVLHTSWKPNSQKHIRELVDSFEEPKADYNAIGLALEAIGKIVLSDLKPLYGHESVAINYFVGRTGLRLEDRDALEIVAAHAKNPESPFRSEAIHELGWALRMYGAGEQLRKLLNDSDHEVRIQAYRALRRRSHPSIKTKVLDRDNLILDVVDSKGPYLIYVQRGTAPRIAVFGRSMRCQLPAIFPGSRNDGRRLVTQLSASRGQEHLTLIYKNKRNGRISPKLRAPLNVAALIEYLGDSPRQDENGKRSGYAVPYSEIVDILSTFCETETIPARFVLQGLEGRDGGSSGEREETEL
ncbi:MAG: flagellar basal body P-ring protein FlgI [Phycisphaerales bacterium]|nr:flagellar basal body P-ring protein FlgI [Phycisphaerales bacterium]